VRAWGAKGGLAIVAEGPGSEELIQGYPLVGPTGRLLNDVLRKGKIDRQQCWITNALLCARPSIDQDMFRAIEHCRPRLEAELQTAAPSAVLALGGTAAKSLKLPVTAISEARGTVQYSPFLPNVPVITSLHPASLFKGGAGEVKGGGKNKQNVDAQMMFLQADVEKAGGVASGAIPAQWSDDIKVITSIEETAAEVKAIIEEARAWCALGIDLEWNKDRMITFLGLGHGGRSISIPWFLMSEEALNAAETAMVDPTLPKIIHNLQADKEIWELCIGPMNGKLIDTMLLHHVGFPGLAHDLQQVATQFLVIPPWKTAHREERKSVDKALKLRDREAKKLAKKMDRMKAHDERNAQKKAEAEERKAQRVAEHEARNAASAAAGQKRRGRPPKVRPSLDAPPPTPVAVVPPEPPAVAPAAEIPVEPTPTPPVPDSPFAALAGALKKKPTKRQLNIVVVDDDGSERPG
jgi:uracil-DNA glycosylase family 4